MTNHRLFCRNTRSIPTRPTPRSSTQTVEYNCRDPKTKLINCTYIMAASNKAIMTGKYDMKMLSRLGKMEEEFKGELAVIWGVDDEDELPDALQELDFNDIMASGDTKEARTAWLIEQINVSEGYAATMAADVGILVGKTVLAIQKLEDDYVHK